MEIKVTVELGEKTFGILEKLFGRIEPVSTAPEVKVEGVGGSQSTAAQHQHNQLQHLYNQHHRQYLLNQQQQYQQPQHLYIL